MRALCRCYDLIGLGRPGTGVWAFLDVYRRGRRTAGSSSTDRCRPMASCAGRRIAFPVGIGAEAFARSAVRAITLVEKEATTAQCHSASAAAQADHRRRPDELPARALRTRFEAIDDLLTRWPEEAGKFTYLQNHAAVAVAEVAALSAAAPRGSSTPPTMLDGNRIPKRRLVPIRFVGQGRVASDAGRQISVQPGRAGSALARRHESPLAEEYVCLRGTRKIERVLMLSRFAGAAAMNSRPRYWSTRSTPAKSASAIRHQALTMSQASGLERWEAMMEVLRGNTIDDWSANFLKALRAAVGMLGLNLVSAWLGS